MRGTSLKFIVLVSLFCVMAVSVSGQAPAKYCKVKFREAGLKYSQLNSGYFQGYYSVWRETGLAYVPTFMVNEISAGFSPWHNAFNVEVNHRHLFMVFSIGIGGGYCVSADLEQQLFYLKPEVGLHLSVFQIYYTYTFASDNINIYHIDSNLTLAIPLFSTTHFGSCENSKRWKKWGVMFSVFKGETWQIWE